MSKKIVKVPGSRFVCRTELRNRKKITDKKRGLNFRLPQQMERAVETELSVWEREGKIGRLWKRDAKLWTGSDEGRWLDWLTVAARQPRDQGRHADFAREIRAAGFKDAVLLGMGGSSMAPEVLRKVFGRRRGFPELRVLDSTDPEQVAALERKLNIARTLFIVSSKSGSTLETDLLKRYFFNKAAAVAGPQRAGHQFVSITDQDSRLHKLALREKHRHVFLGHKGVGGRFSVLSDFGLMPAALIGVDALKILRNAERMVAMCRPEVPIRENPGAMLGIILGVAAKRFGRDKVTLITSSYLAPFGAWFEQMLAESTGKGGKGLIPVDGESVASPKQYDNDRVFVFITLRGAKNVFGRKSSALERAGHPIVRIVLDDIYGLGGVFFSFQMATAVAGAILGVHPFDQPDVEVNKIITKKFLARISRAGELPAEKPFFRSEDASVFADRKNAKAITAAAPRPRGAALSLPDLIAAHLHRLKSGDYLAFLAYLPRTREYERALAGARAHIRATFHVATSVGFGPRFLHSTGQLFKGGPGSGVFIIITGDDEFDLALPGEPYGLSAVKSAQARGDFEVLNARGRRVIRIHLPRPVGGNLKKLFTILRALKK